VLALDYIYTEFFLKCSGQVRDPLRKQRDLNLGGSRVARLASDFGNDSDLALPAARAMSIFPFSCFWVPDLQKMLSESINDTLFRDCAGTADVEDAERSGHLVGGAFSATASNWPSGPRTW